jgi:NHLM bacteriocin system ABC transporter peptidase/ATP-binding protein
LQSEAVECGAACLAIVLARFGSWVPLDELRLACGVSRDGSRAASLWHAAQRYGLEAKAFKAEPRDLRRFQPPMILHWNFNHFVVLEGFEQDRVYLNDPACGPHVVSSTELDESFTGVVLLCQPATGFVPRGRRPSFARSLAGWLRGTSAALGFVLVCGLALMVLRLIAPFFSKVLVETVLLADGGEWLVPLLSWMGAAALALCLFTWLQQTYLARLSSWLALTGSSRLFWHILRLPVAFFSQRFVGDITSRLTLTSRVAEILSRDLATNFLNAMMIVVFGGLMLQYNPVLTGTCLVVVVLDMAALRYVSRKRVDGNRLLLRESGKLQGSILGGLEMIETIKATGAEADLLARWTGYQAKIINLGQELELSSVWLQAVPPLLGALNAAAVLGIGSLQVMRGALSLGELVAFQLLVAMFLLPVARLVSLGGKLQIVAGDMNRLEDVLRHPTDVSLAADPVAPVGEVAKLAGLLEFRNVSFGYDRLAPPLIEGFNLRIRPGERIALVGPSGSGKSTLARLAAGLLDPWSGEIRFDNLVPSELPRAVLTASLAVVDQAITLFEGSVWDNLTLWDPTILREEVDAAAEDAAIQEEILARPGGYESPVEEGGRNWSGGQRQRLEIARALAGRPSILVLDEATSALDPATELEIDERLRRRGCSCLIVAHRLSTLRDADQIVVLDRGKVVQRGTHEELLQEDGLYRRLAALN